MVTTLSGFQEYVIIRDDVFSTPIPDATDQVAVMSVYGPTGATAYFGMTGIGKPRPGDTVVVSAAAGATGSVAGRSPRSPARGWSASRAGRRSAESWWRSSVLTRVSITNKAIWRTRSASIARAASTSTSTMSAALSSTRCWVAWRTRHGWCCAESSPAT
ncbi:putative 2-alkenal reductase [Mycobacterium xenopi 3993]|nr:putative 2-alkenal reductase [Mycobacterium xenopi 3993]